jgi:cytochrome c553
MTTLKTVIVTLIIAAAVVMAGIVAYIYSGAYAIGADKPDGPVVGWVIHTTMKRSLASSAAEIDPPKNLDNPTLIHMGARHYKEMCVSCHKERMNTIRKEIIV